MGACGCGVVNAGLIAVERTGEVDFSALNVVHVEEAHLV